MFRKALFTVMMTSLIASCSSVNDPASYVKADDPDIKIKVAIGKVTSGKASLYFSAPQNIDSLIFCKTDDRDLCLAGSEIALNTSVDSSLQSESLKIFKSNVTLSLESQTISMIAFVGTERVASRVAGLKNKGAEDDANTNLSLGTGGQLGEIEVQYTDTQGVSSTYKANAPQDSGVNKAYGLHIHLHGDGGGGYRDFPNLEPKHDLIGVTVKAPNRNLQWGRREGRSHSNYVNDLIQNELVKKYNIDKTKIYFSGVSGGAYFLTGSFIPEFGHNYNSGAFILCGGEAPRVEFTDPSTLVNFRVYWQVTQGERRDISGNISQSTAAYSNLLNTYLSQNSITNFDAKSVQDIQVEGRGGHCEFDGLGYTRGIQSMMDRRFNVVFKQN